MTWKRWIFTALSFAAVLGISAYFTAHWWGEGTSINLPWQAHVLAQIRSPAVRRKAQPPAAYAQNHEGVHMKRTRLTAATAAGSSLPPSVAPTTSAPDPIAPGATNDNCIVSLPKINWRRRRLPGRQKTMLA